MIGFVMYIGLGCLVDILMYGHEAMGVMMVAHIALWWVFLILHSLYYAIMLLLLLLIIAIPVVICLRLRKRAKRARFRAGIPMSQTRRGGRAL